jgi:excinuclease ABC subunit C
MKKPAFSKIPQQNGVYLFRRGRTVLYVGKAKNLRQRLRSYFAANAGSKTKQLVTESTGLTTRPTATEPDSLILEAQLIKKHQPQFNVAFRDDKSYFYVAFSRDPLARVSIVHEQHVRHGVSRFKETIGPFTDGTSLKKIIYRLRRLFPFCTCKSWHERPCIQSSLGLCAGACCLKPKALKEKYPFLGSDSVKRRYLRNIEALKAVINGKQKNLVKRLESQMRAAAKTQRYEEAAQARDLSVKLQKLWQHSLGSTSSDIFERIESLEQLKSSLHLTKMARRIEGYDISNIFGTNAVGSMVVFTNGMPDKNEYRKFKIRRVKGINDIAMLEETLSRRLSHKEWPMPDLFFIDGGIAQLHAAMCALHMHKSIPIIAFAKGQQEVWSTKLKAPLMLKNIPEKARWLIIRIKDEAHRFAVSYHRNLRRTGTLRN